MEAFVRALVIYIGVFLFVRLSGRRTLSELTTFDFVLLLIIGEATQQALLGEDFSLTHAIVLIVSLVLIDIVLSLIRQKWRRVDEGDGYRTSPFMYGPDLFPAEYQYARRPFSFQGPRQRAEKLLPAHLRHPKGWYL